MPETRWPSRGGRETRCSIFEASETVRCARMRGGVATWTLRREDRHVGGFEAGRASGSETHRGSQGERVGPKRRAEDAKNCAGRAATTQGLRAPPSRDWGKGSVRETV